MEGGGCLKKKKKKSKFFLNVDIKEKQLKSDFGLEYFLKKSLGQSGIHMGVKMTR